MTYFLARFKKFKSEQTFYKLVRAGNLRQASSIAEREHPEGYGIIVTEALE
jgi:hypothetical protein